MKEVVIYGVGKMAEFIYYSFQNDSNYKIAAFCVDDSYLSSEKQTLFGYPVIPFTETLRAFPPDRYLLHIAIGRNSARELIFHKAQESGYEFANYVCSKANVWPDLVIGRNVFIDQASVIQPYVTIGDNCMLIGARIGHHSQIGNNSLLSGTSLAGSVIVGANSFLGLNSSVKEGVQIGEQNIISAGCFVSKNTANGSLIYQARTVQKVAASRNIVLFNAPDANRDDLQTLKK